MRYINCLLFFLSFSIMLNAQETINGNLMHDDLNRSYILYVPDSYTADTPASLIFNFHGYTSNAEQQMWYGDFREIADTAGFLLVHPQGTLLNGSTHWNVGGWTVGSTVDDVGFTEALIDTLAAAYNINMDRIYATGMSNGGYMSFLLACQLSDKIAAIASVTGSMTPEIYNECDPQHPTPIMQIHGTTDGVVPYNGAAWTRSINDVLNYWVSFNNCSDTPEITDVPNTSIADGSTAERMVYYDGDNGVRAEHYKITLGGHTWPGTAFVTLGTNQDFDASEEIWRFFSQYDINGLIDPTTAIDDLAGQNEVKIFPNPTASQLIIDHDFQTTENYEILSMEGKLMMKGQMEFSQTKVDLSSLTPNVYILKIGNYRVKIVKSE